LKNVFLEALQEAESIPYFHNQNELRLDFLQKLDCKAVIRLYAGKMDGSWLIFSSDPEVAADFSTLIDFSDRFAKISENELHAFHMVDFQQATYATFLSPYIVEGYHLGDLMLLQKCQQTPNFAELKEHQLFCDLLSNFICAKFQFADHVMPKIGSDSDKFLSFIRETQLILTASQNAVALTIEQEKLQARQWFNEDQPVLTRFMAKVMQELNLHSIFILQNAAPGFYHQLTLTSASTAKAAESEISEMIEAVKQLDNEVERSIITEHFSCCENKEDCPANLVPMVFSCQAGGLTFGNLGIFTTRHNLARYINHRSKILPMLANQLGFYFSHLYQLRREALEARMLQQINQTCNTINSSVDIGAILFKLVESLNNLFRQYSGAVLINSLETQELEVTTQLGGPVPEDLNIHEVIANHPQIVDLINEGAVFDNRDGSYPLPIRYILPLSATPQAQIISPELLTPRSLGAVILYEHPTNKHLSEETLQKLVPILLNGISASLQVARNYTEKLETIKALEGLMAKLSDTDALLDEMITIIRGLLKVNRISFLTLDESEKYLFIKKEYGLPPGIKETTRIPIGDEISGFVALNGKSIRIDNIERDGNFKKRSMEHYLNRSLLSVPLISKNSRTGEKVIGVINVNNKTNGLTFTQQDQQLLEAIAHLVVTALEKVRFLEEKHEKDLLDRQLNDARDIQMSLMPKTFGDLPDTIEIYGKSLPARQIGGDFFDIVNLDDGRVLLALGDVSGKGMPAAILMAVSRMILRQVVQDTIELTQILEKVNQKLSKELDSYHFVTLQIVAIDPKSGAAEMFSAGHGPLMVRLSEKTRLIETKGGPPLGIPGLSGVYDKQSFSMHPGDCLIMFTDGLSEEHSTEREMFGSERIESFLNKFSQLSARQITENMIQEATRWRGNQEAHDDLTLLSMKFKDTSA
jgi:sigma-B regulation protein RsbU (phosphoserine phosphatase)